MGSIAMDHVGNMGLGFSASSGTINPGIRYTGRLSGDALGQMTQGEGTIINGTGSQTGGLNRWGDYSDLTIDPSDDCTFWYTTEYLTTNGSWNWHTRIASFSFPSCSGGGGCNAPSGFANNTATDINACLDSGVSITWQNPSNWGDSGGTRTHDVLRDGNVIASGLSEATTSYTDNTGQNGVSYSYTVRHNNGCGSSATTSGAQAADNIGGSGTTETANQSVTPIQAKNSTATSSLVPAFTISALNASAANITWSLGGNTDLTNCAVLSLRAPGSAELTLKGAGQSNPGSANVLSFYKTNGPGTYTIVLSELNGCERINRNAQVSSSQMVVQSGSSCGGNNPPVASFSYNCSGLACSFTDASTDLDGSIVSRSWTFGDGGNSTAQNPSHTYATGGTYNVTLLVTDNGGAQDSDVQSVNVSPGGGYTLSTTGYKVRGVQTVDLNWSGASGGNVDVFRDGVKIATPSNTGFYTDNVGVKGGGVTYTYQVCNTGVSTCSNISSVIF
jgi:PKD repeat protein